MSERGFELQGRRGQKAKKESGKLERWKQNVLGRRSPFTDYPGVFELELPVGRLLPTPVAPKETVPKTTKPSGGS